MGKFKKGELCLYLSPYPTLTLLDAAPCKILFDPAQGTQSCIISTATILSHKTLSKRFENRTGVKLVLISLSFCPIHTAKPHHHITFISIYRIIICLYILFICMLYKILEIYQSFAFPLGQTLMMLPMQFLHRIHFIFYSVADAQRVDIVRDNLLLYFRRCHVNVTVLLSFAVEKKL